MISQDDLANGILPLKSRIRADKIMQIDKNLIVGEPFAKIKGATFDALLEEIIKLLRREC